ncbi:MAG: hypothetical protein ACREUM_11620 [Nitrosospira sp.]
MLVSLLPNRFRATNQEKNETMKAVELKQQIPNPSLEEFQRSHHLLEAFITLLPPHAQAELVNLLQTLSESQISPESANSMRQRALQIVAGICKPNQPQEQAPVETTPREYQKRVGERRQRDRREQPANSGKPWTTQQEQILRSLAEQNTPIRRIALRLGRTSTAVQSKAKEINLPLNPIKVSAN